MSETLILSPLNKTWIIDLDGTIVKHNGYKLDGKDSLLPGAQEFLARIPPNDMIIFLTSRPSEMAANTERFLIHHNIRYNNIIYNAPYGERIILNDNKPTGLTCAYAINLERDKGLKEITYTINIDL